jgi:phthiocerol/phenolphthiocerol synthesis type-I polyketide synthase C
VTTELTAACDEDVVVLRGEQRWVGRRERGAAAGGLVHPWRTGATDQPYRVAATRPGQLDALGRHPLVRRAPGPGEVEIEVEAVSLNFIDVMKALDVYPDPAAGAGGLGLECAGTVVAVGAGVQRVAPGDVVIGCGVGLLGTHAVVDARHVSPVPPGLDPLRACALPTALATAWYSLVNVAAVRPGETVLIHSAAGGVGLAALGVARQRGAAVLATAGTEGKREHLRRMGVEHVLDSRSLCDWTAGVRAATGGRGVDVVLNSLAGPAIAAGLDLLADDGRFVELGKKDIHAGTPLDLRAFRRAVAFTAVDLAGMLRRAPERFAQLLDEVWWQVVAGTLPLLPVRSLPFAETEQAFRTLASGAHIGKVVLTGPRDGGPVAPDHRIRPGCTYLITGGLGALGLSLAEFLVSRGADSVALVGRSEPGADALRRIAALRTQGATVRSWAADVADEERMSTVLAELRSGMAELRGVVHAAGILDDATVTRITAEQIERVLRPKFDGALVLDRLTADDSLDLFVLFSSVAAFAGTAGQAVYAAANAGLDALAQRRRRAGLPGLSVQWGSVGGIGLAARGAERGGRLADRGLAAIASSGLLAGAVARARGGRSGRLLRGAGPAPVGADEPGGGSTAQLVVPARVRADRDGQRPGRGAARSAGRRTPPARRAHGPAGRGIRADARRGRAGARP